MTNAKAIHSVVLMALTLICGCASSPVSPTKYAVKEADDQMEIHGTIDGKRIGLDGQKQIIIQEETSPEGEIKVQELKNYEAERTLTAKHEELTQCREEFADQRLGGSGEVTEIPEIDNMKTIPEVKEAIGITEKGQLTVVKREFYIERLQAERRYEQAMLEMLRVINRFNRKCQREMAAARTKVGLPAKRYEGVGHFEAGGRWVVERKAEKTLDDAFEIQKQMGGASPEKRSAQND